MKHVLGRILDERGAPEARQIDSPRREPWESDRQPSSPRGATQSGKTTSGSGVAPTGLRLPGIATHGFRHGLAICRSSGAAFRELLRLAARMAVVFIVLSGFAATLHGQAPPATGDQRMVMVNYYKLAPGKTEEWLQLYKTQHLPILKQRQKDGDLLNIEMYRPIVHQGQPDWDFKVVLTFRDPPAFGNRTRSDAIERKLYTDFAAHQRAEQRRWEITQKHWDDLVAPVPLD